MKKVILSISAIAILASFTACNCNSDATESCTTTPKEDATSEIVEQTGTTKCGSEKSGEEKPDKFAMMDTDQNGSLSEEEFTTFVAAKFSVKDINSNGFLSKDECPHFDQVNTDGDDKVSEPEFKAALKGLFSSIDTDQNSVISRAELKAQMQAEQSENTETEHKCGEGKCSEGKCGSEK